MKQLGQRTSADEDESNRREEDSGIKTRARPRSSEAPSGRPFLFGFARPAGPDHGPKEDSRVNTRKFVQQVFSILFSLNAFVLFWAVRSVLAGRHSLPVSFHAGGVTPSLTFRSGTAFAGVNPSKPREGVTPPARKKRGPGSARAARGGVLSRPDERTRVKTKERPKKFVLWTKINNFVAKQKLNLL